MKLSQLLVDLAFFLEGSTKYKKIKLFFKNLLENENYLYKKYFDYFMIFLILSSVIILIEEVTTPIHKILLYYDIYFVTGVFVIEYILRLWVYNDVRKIIIEEFENSVFLQKGFDTKGVLREIFKKKLEYIISPLAIIDLLAILPSYRELRILRIFVLFRVFKLLRYSQNITHFLQVIASKKVELFTLLFLVAFVVMVAGISIYVFEEQKNPNISTLFDAFYWALVTISTVGYGDISPMTNEGRGITIFIILTGVGLISFATSIIVSAFNEKMDEVKESKIISNLNRLDNLYIICGYTHISELIANRFKKENKNFLIIDLDKDKVKKAIEKGYYAILGDASKKDIFKKLNIEKIKAILAMTDHDMHNIYICLNVRSFSQDIFIISRAIDKNSYKKLKLAGANYLISPYETAGIYASKIIEQPIAITALNDILTAKKNALCDQVEVVNGSFLENRRVKDIDFSEYKLILLGILRSLKEEKLPGIKRKFYFNPEDDFLIRANDILIIIGYNISINNFKSQVTESTLEHAKKRR